jgi:rubrerythrin
MSRTFSATEVFEIAEQIERNGAVFYRKAAQRFRDSEAGGIFAKLADREVEHEAAFAALRKQLAKEPEELSRFDSEDLPVDAKAMAGLSAFGINADATDELAGCKTQVDALKIALQKEKDTIVFYTGLKEFVPVAVAVKEIGNIIAEELRHVRIMIEALEECE